MCKTQEANEIDKGKYLTFVGTAELGRGGGGASDADEIVYFQARCSLAISSVTKVLVRGSIVFKISCECTRTPGWLAHSTLDHGLTTFNCALRLFFH